MDGILTQASPSEPLTHALAAAARAFLVALENAGVDVTAPQGQAPQHRRGGEVGSTYDPLNDEPPLSAKPYGTSTEQKMAALAFLGSIARINAQARRGADSGEIAQFAKRAGYQDGRAVSGWNSREGSSRLVENKEGARILNAEGHAYVRELADQLSLTLQGDIDPLGIPGEELA